MTTNTADVLATVHCAGCRGTDYLDRPCRGRQVLARPELERLRAAVKQARDYFELNAADYYRLYGNNEDPVDVLRAACEV